MILDFNKSKDDAWRDIKHEIHRGALDKKHPFRFIVLSTGDSGEIQSRWVVLRKVDDNLHCYIYTDKRTQKIDALKNNYKAHVLMYHDKKKIQIRCQGKVCIHHQNELSRNHWNNVQGIAKRAYTPGVAPGTLIGSPEQAHEWNMDLEDQYFSVLEFIPEEMDVLQLNKSEHLRMKATKTEGGWIKEWVAP